MPAWRRTNRRRSANGVLAITFVACVSRGGVAVPTFAVITAQYCSQHAAAHGALANPLTAGDGVSGLHRVSLRRARPVLCPKPVRIAAAHSPAAAGPFDKGFEPSSTGRAPFVSR